MTHTTRTLAVVSAGLSDPSSTRLLADRLTEATVGELETAGHTVTVETIELREHAHAVVDAMLTGFPTGDLATVLNRLYAADGLIAVTPLFTTTYSGLFKSFVDILDRDALHDLPVLLAATGGTPRHSLALDYSMRPLFTYLHADVLSTAVFAATDDWAGQDDRVNPLPERIARAGRDLAAAVAARQQAPTAADPFESTPSFAELLAREGL
ncbi:NADPH-dependent FMN reductase [Xylanimonas cellulosilytica DSM 15894]|uniref:NADPH-dependent FMN reductase n=1 Tax=Xylanimonas cellulosilytica (strain DSM 15894 / JCM 12276 / CECT 5975 / KCTC 9989 / LMG 20990 / NBRC 107835 / XIL07) TaxID=446471 RepID=D1BSV0_XYLCX|nr:FMN reductase [Xylanimonas cellulosilytica]ACZ30792.1 NADPH-dependent FMN reductase [Xylanimonas cellulosilytica DSM 15894]